MVMILTSWLAFSGLFWLASVTSRTKIGSVGALDASAVRRFSRFVGYVFLTLSPLPWIFRDGIAMATVSWLFCALPIIGAATVLAVTYFPRAGAILSGLAIIRSAGHSVVTSRSAQN